MIKVFCTSHRELIDITPSDVVQLAQLAQTDGVNAIIVADCENNMADFKILESALMTSFNELNHRIQVATNLGDLFAEPPKNI